MRGRLRTKPFKIAAVRQVRLCHSKKPIHLNRFDQAAAVLNALVRLTCPARYGAATWDGGWLFGGATYFNPELRGAAAIRAFKRQSSQAQRPMLDTLFLIDDLWHFDSQQTISGVHMPAVWRRVTQTSSMAQRSDGLRWAPGTGHPQWPQPGMTNRAWRGPRNNSGSAEQLWLMVSTAATTRPGASSGSNTGAWPYNRPCAQQYVGKYQSCMVLSGRLIVHAPVRLKWTWTLERPPRQRRNTHRSSQ